VHLLIESTAVSLTWLLPSPPSAGCVTVLVLPDGLVVAKDVRKVVICRWFSFTSYYSCNWYWTACIRFTARFCTYTPAGWERPLVCPFLGLLRLPRDEALRDVSTVRKARYYVHWHWAPWQPGMWWLRYVHNYPVMAT